jgi:hypothetical protein
MHAPRLERKEMKDSIKVRLASILVEDEDSVFIVRSGSGELYLLAFFDFLNSSIG